MYKLIIIDDEEMIQQGLLQLVDWSELNIEIVGCASNGIKALELIEKENPNIMICDIKMPVMSGLELLKTLVKSGRNIRTIILSGYEDFSYVKEAMGYKVENYLLKPVDKDELFFTLLNIIDKLDKNLYEKIELRNYSNMIKYNILNRLILNQISEKELEEKIESLQIKLTPPYRIAIIKLLQLNHKISKQDLQWKSVIVENIVKEILSYHNAGLCFQSIKDSNCVLILNAGSIEKENSSSILQKCLVNIIDLTKEEVLITVGSPFGDMILAPVSFNDAHNLLDYMHIKVKNKVLFYEECCKKIEAAAIFNLDMEAFEEYITDCQSKEALDFLIQVFSEQIRDTIKPSQIKSLFMSLITCCFNVLRRMKIDVEELLENQTPFEKVLLDEADQPLFEWLQTFVLNIIQSIKNKKSKSSTRINAILEYVNKNYEKDLTLKILANEFNLTPPYVGTLFKSATGEIFSEYLNKLRVEKAKGLLLTTELSASRISKLIGYWDSNYFYKIFKKYTGVFPTEFRSN